MSFERPAEWLQTAQGQFATASLLPGYLQSYFTNAARKEASDMGSRRDKCHMTQPVLWSNTADPHTLPLPHS